MPYLSWETDRQREKLSKALNLESERYLEAALAKESKQRLERQRDRGDLTIPWLSKKGKDVAWPHGTQRFPPPIRRASTALWRSWLAGRKEAREGLSPFRRDKGRIIAGTMVGQVLLDAAVVYEAMASYRDRMFISKYLHKDPPLHPRRTLDQGYYWTLKTTRLRERDQVVYRGTAVGRDQWHKLLLKQTTQSPGPGIDEQRFEWDCRKQNDARRPAQPRGRPTDRFGPTYGGPEETLGIRCWNCRDNIRHVPRVVMVDQLWMWILDERTMITCLPERYGIKERAFSGVHKSIRTKIESLKKGHIRTVFDLALIVVDECSRSLFAPTGIKVSVQLSIMEHHSSNDLVSFRDFNLRSWTFFPEPSEIS